MKTKLDEIIERVSGTRRSPGTVSPGPWEVLKSETLDTIAVASGAARFSVPFAVLGKDALGTDTREANARLISAAPDLLDAAHKAIDLLESATDEKSKFVLDVLVLAVLKAQGGV